MINNESLNAELPQSPSSLTKGSPFERMLLCSLGLPGSKVREIQLQLGETKRNFWFLAHVIKL